MKTVKFLQAHLNVWWLRPENALWDTIASNLICRYRINQPSLDLGCGNGIFSFITAGGEFSIDYDWYVNTDIRDFWKNKDIYNTCKVDDLSRFITKRPAYFFSVGLDHKPDLLRQAEKLGFYQNSLQYDANKQLPFNDFEFKTVFCNILYWLEDLERPLRQIYRVLNKGGVAILCMPDPRFLQYCFTYQWKKRNSQLLKLLNRGRSELMYWMVSYRNFSVLSKAIGFNIIEHSYYLCPHILKFWDIGLRPLSPLLIKMTNGLSSSQRREIKAEWIETAMKFLLPLYEIEKKEKDKGGFHLFVLQK